jgi:2-polyprenyl-6-methoxyphenol hydroxylase-like FAD-dependent oxidoreductase
MAGLTAARVLADHFAQVVVLERDALPAEPAYRPGTPQARHVHLLLAGGQQALCELFPGFEQELAQAGGVPIRSGLDLRWEPAGYDPFPQRDLGSVSYAMSRPLLEFLVRRRVAQCANVAFHSGCRAQEFLTTPDGATVVAVCYENSDGRSETLTADLVLDASGRGGLTLALLAANGRPLPEETTIGVDIGYSTAIFAIPDDAPSSWKGVMTLPQAPEGQRGVVMLPLEGNRWIATLSGRGGDKPPANMEGFLAFAQQLRTPTLFNAIKHAKCLGGVTRYVFPASLRRHFERLESFPRGLLPLGDVICRFNPVYGQGMSVAAQEAGLLQRLLSARGPRAGLAPAFFAEVPSLIETPWAIAANLDFTFPETKGQRPPQFEGWLRFQAALFRLAARDPAVHHLMMEVQGLLKPRSVYSDPEFARRVKAEIAAA